MMGKRVKGDCGHIGLPQNFTVVKGQEDDDGNICEVLVCDDCADSGIGDVLRVASERDLFVKE